MIRVPTDRKPTHPGEMLLEEFLKPMDLSPHKLADAIRVPSQRINEIVHGRRGVTPSTALQLSKIRDGSAYSSAAVLIGGMIGFMDADL